MTTNSTELCFNCWKDTDYIYTDEHVNLSWSVSNQYVEFVRETQRRASVY